jgi:hypothetical protein
VRPILHELNEFGQYLSKLAERAEISIHRAAIEAGFKSPSTLFYAIRKSERRGRPTTLTAEVLVKLAEAVKADRDESFRLVVLGLSQQLAPQLRDYLAYLEREVASLRKELGKKPSRARFTIDP